MRRGKIICALVAAAVLSGCEKIEMVGGPVTSGTEAPSFVSLEDVAKLFSSLPIGTEQMTEVYDAALSSAQNGYDEEYLMKDLFAAPGAGVGDQGTKAGSYSRPLRDLIREAVDGTKSSGGSGLQWLDSLSVSDVQIYWPFSESWDGKTLPVVTYDPGDFATSNVGYALRADGSVQTVMVDEQMAMERPVWVMNRNTDAEFKSLELRRREDPSWGNGGGDIIVRPSSNSGEDSGIKTLLLRSFKALRQYDSWFAGASEFFVKVGAVEDFMASTEAELRLYDPSITDFMIVVRRKDVGKDIPFNAILVSEWTKNLKNCALMIIEDDGGTRTTWKSNAMVKVNSKSYGFEIEIPLYTHDDVVWRGSLTRNYIEKYSGSTGHFGDVDMILELL